MIHAFDVDHAQEYGLHEAILLHSFVFWITNNRANEWHFHDGRTWSYNSLKAFNEQFPYLTTKQIRAALASLIDKGVLVKGYHGKAEGWNSFDRTLWYAFADEDRFLVRRAQTVPDTPSEPICPIGQMHVPEMHLPPRANQFAPQGKSICPPGQINLPPRANESKDALVPHREHAYIYSRQAGNAHDAHDAREHPNDCPTACLPAADIRKGSDSDGDQNAPSVVAGFPPVQEKPDEGLLSEGAALLLRPVAEGGAGFDSRARAEQFARVREAEELRHWIRLAKSRGATNVAGFIVAALTRGDAPPESYLRAVKADYQAGGGPLAPLFGGVVQSLPRDEVPQESGRPAHMEEDDEDGDDGPRRPAPRPRQPESRPNAAAYRIWRGH